MFFGVIAHIFQSLEKCNRMSLKHKADNLLWHACCNSGHTPRRDVAALVLHLLPRIATCGIAWGRAEGVRFALMQTRHLSFRGRRRFTVRLTNCSKTVTLLVLTTFTRVCVWLTSLMVICLHYHFAFVLEMFIFVHISKVCVSQN